MQSQGYKAYASALGMAIGPRELERMALASTIRKLIAVQENYSPGKQGYGLYVEALKFNQQLWTLIQSNIIENPASGTEALRSNFLELSLYVDRHTVKALSDPDPESLTPLIEINKIISSGLNSSPTKAQEATFAPETRKAPTPSGF